MSQAVHALEGYALCRECESWVRDEVARRTGGLCPDHFAAAGGKRVTTLELVGRGMRVRIPTTPRQRRRPARGTPERDARKRLGAKAKRQARRRLAAIFPDIYDVLLAEERGALGLEPWPTEIAIRGNSADVEIGFAEMMRELDERGVAV